MNQQSNDADKKNPSYLESFIDIGQDEIPKEQVEFRGPVSRRTNEESIQSQFSFGIKQKNQLDQTPQNHNQEYYTNDSNIAFQCVTPKGTNTQQQEQFFLSEQKSQPLLQQKQNLPNQVTQHQVNQINNTNTTQPQKQNNNTISNSKQLQSNNEKKSSIDKQIEKNQTQQKDKQQTSQIKKESPLILIQDFQSQQQLKANNNQKPESQRKQSLTPEKNVLNQNLNLTKAQQMVAKSQDEFDNLIKKQQQQIQGQQQHQPLQNMPQNKQIPQAFQTNSNTQSIQQLINNQQSGQKKFEEVKVNQKQSQSDLVKAGIQISQINTIDKSNIQPHQLQQIQQMQKIQLNVDDLPPSLMTRQQSSRSYTQQSQQLNSVGNSGKQRTPEKTPPKKDIIPQQQKQKTGTLKINLMRVPFPNKVNHSQSTSNQGNSVQQHDNSILQFTDNKSAKSECDLADLEQDLQEGEIQIKQSQATKTIESVSNEQLNIQKKSFQKLNQQQFQQYVPQFNENPEQCINNLIATNILPSDAQKIAQFLIEVEGLNKDKISQFISLPIQNQQQSQIFKQFCLQNEIWKQSIDQALMQLMHKVNLQQNGRKVLSLFQNFISFYHQENNEVYENKLIVEIITYSCLLLLLDYNPKQMLQQQLQNIQKEHFIKSNAQVCKTVSQSFFEQLFERLIANSFEINNKFLQNSYFRYKVLNMEKTGDKFIKFLQNQLVLKEGYTFLKYGRKGKPHQRLCFVSENEDKVCWKSPDNQAEQPRFMMIDQINDVTLGSESTPVIKKYNISKQEDTECFSLVSQQRTLDLRVKDLQIKAKWVNYFRQCIEFKHAIQTINKDMKRNQQHRLLQVWKSQILNNLDLYWDYDKKQPRFLEDLHNGQILSTFKKRVKQQQTTMSKQSDAFEILIQQLSLNKGYTLINFWKQGIPNKLRKTI